MFYSGEKIFMQIYFHTHDKISNNVCRTISILNFSLNYIINTISNSDIMPRCSDVPHWSETLVLQDPFHFLTKTW